MPKPIQRVKFTKAIARHTKIRDQNPSLGYIRPGEPHERSPNAPKFEDRSQEETELQEQGAREAAWRLAKNVLKLKEHERAAFFSSPENRCPPASTLNPEEREFVVDSGASMHMISKKDLSEAEMDTLTKSCSPTIVITANGEVQTQEKIGDLITADHKVLSDNCESRNNYRYAIVVQDSATQWIQAYPGKTKTSQENLRSLQKFLEPDGKPKVIYTDNSLEFGKACEDLSWNHCTSTPHRSETDGIAERAVRRVKEGTSAVLLQSGLSENWWADSMECYTYLRNVADYYLMGRRLMKDVLGNHLEDLLFPFGSSVEYHPTTSKDQSRIH